MTVRQRPTGDKSPPIHGEAIERVRGLLDRWMARTAEHLVIAMIKRGEPKTVVVSSEDYEGYLHTLEIMGDADAQSAIREGEQDERDGRVRSYEEARRDLGLASFQDHATG